MSKIKAIILDYGGVLTYKNKWDDHIIKIADEKGLDAETILQKLKSIWKKAKIEEVSPSDFWNKMSELLGIELDKIKEQVYEFFKLNPDMINLVKALKSNYKTVLLSNQLSDWLGRVMAENNFPEIFDLIITSYDTKINKPDKRHYDMIFEQTNFAPEEMVMIDDQSKNTDLASALGINSILYDNYNQLIRELSKLNITID